MLFQMSHPTTLSKIFTFIQNHNIKRDEKNMHFIVVQRKNFYLKFLP